MHFYAKANYFKFNKKLYTHSYCIQLCHKYLQPNRMLSSRLYCNIGIQYCNIDVQVARSILQSLKSLTSCRSIITLVFNVLNLSHKHVIYKYFKSFKGCIMSVHRLKHKCVTLRLRPNSTILDF